MDVHIYILPLQFSDKDLLVKISNILKESFGLSVIFLDSFIHLEEGRDPIRNQYNSTWILSQLLKQVPEESCKILGVTEKDLYVPVLTYVFGEAQLNGKAAVVSIYRLRDELYGLPKNPQRLKERLEKEAIHELGHTFGLIHCRNPECVMYPTTYAEEIDYKSKNFCRVCSDFLKKKEKST
ncbi:MAG: archaemetzincin family Zn-dependent metalloprotease [Candidatus Aerophobus sp.]|nr:MAG: archaemetzincin family Zn-dependent metalloprotease [Candidatus Aerophobus sp.]